MPKIPNAAAFRTEHDSMGDLQVPADALWGAQTQRAVQNFPISGRPMPRGFIRALGLVKAAAAEVNAGLGLLPEKAGKAIRNAALEVAEGRHDVQFPVDIYQTGSGTSSNMNANEVIATLASSASRTIHPNDHVNLGQSSNDVVPTAIRVSTQLAVIEDLLPALKHLRRTIDKRGKALGKVVKTGRTHLMDAMPLTFAQEFGAWSSQLASAEARLDDTLKRLRRLPIGGTAIGTGINADPRYQSIAVRRLAEISGQPLRQAADLIEATSDMGSFVLFSGMLKRLAVKLSKICNDLRLLSSGPRTGFNEINLPPRQPGSSIMPGKVNPVIPEAVNQVAFEVIGNDLALTMAAEGGQLQLNVMEPLIAYKLFDSIRLLQRAMDMLREHCIEGITANEARCRELMESSIGLITALNPYIGYDNSTRLAREALLGGRSVLELVREERLLDEAMLAEILRPENMIAPRLAPLAV